MILNVLYPWQGKVWRLVNQDNQRLPHAMLFYGRAGIGKYDFALHLSKSLLCPSRFLASNLNPQGHACGICSSCNWFDDESHPDFRLLSPEQESESEDEGIPTKKNKKKTQISVLQIRDLSSFLSLSSHRSGGLRVILVHPAEALNLASANALLKILEEPAEGVIFILVAHQLQHLLPTIISRCQKISMPIPDEMQALAWLNEQGVQNAKQQLAYLDGSPIKVLAEQVQFSQLTEVWRLLALGEKLPAHIAAAALIASSVETGIIALQKWIYDIVAIRLTQQPRYHAMHIGALQVLADKVNLSKLLQLQKKVDALRKLTLHPLNHELQMESLLIEYTRLFMSRKPS